jgi:phage-related protein
VKDNAMILLHGFIKKSQKTPLADLRIARLRLGQIKGVE